MRSIARSPLRACRQALSLCAASCVLWAAGCAGVVSGGGEQTAVAEHVSEHYRVRVIGGGMGGQRGQELARHGAMMMERMFAIYSGQEEIPLPPGGVMPFNLHLNQREYDRQAALYDFPANTTNGFCTTSGEAHVFYHRGGTPSPESTAMHEGFHQYCHRALHYPTPMEVYQRVPGYKIGKLPTVPLWLNEGMAMNMESGTVQRDHNGIVVAVDDVGSVNRDRLSHLVQIINNGRCPPVRGVMNKIMGEEISIDDYAVMWGIVFDLRMATGNAIFAREQREIERAGPEAVRAAIDAAIDPARPYPYLRWPVPVAGRFLRACRVAWGLDVPSLIDVCATGAREPRDFDRQWNRRLTQAALAEVEKMLRDHGETLEEWERGWRRRMLTLNAEVRGGSYVYTEPAGAGSLRNRFPGGGSRSPGGW